MKLNGITCLSYQEKPDHFEAVLVDTTREAILAINPYELTITTDANNVVETFNAFSDASTLSENLSNGQFTVCFERSSATIKNLTQSVQQLQADKEALAESNRVLEECIVEMASVIYA